MLNFNRKSQMEISSVSLKSLSIFSNVPKSKNSSLKIVLYHDRKATTEDSQVDFHVCSLQLIHEPGCYYRL